MFDENMLNCKFGTQIKRNNTEARKERTLEVGVGCLAKGGSGGDEPPLKDD